MKHEYTITALNWDEVTKKHDSINLVNFINRKVHLQRVDIHTHEHTSGLVVYENEVTQEYCEEQSPSNDGTKWWAVIDVETGKFIGDLKYFEVLKNE